MAAVFKLVELVGTSNTSFADAARNAVAEASKTLAANQGLYNGFLAAGLIWGLSLGSAGFAVKTFFLACVLVAGIFGGLTAGRKILWIQALPALIALLLLHLA